MKNEIELKPSYWANVSGGKDSLLMLKIILENPDKYPLDGVVHSELEIDFPFIKNVVDYMEKECKKKGIPFLRIKPRVTWKELYDLYGFPNSNNILVYIDYSNNSYRIDIPIDYSPYKDVNSAVSQLVEYASKRYFDMVYRERFRV